ncbi:DUF2183 domain-containing protein [bacterium]|nr:DUF2183 domain-containing protein [bacterium]
MKINNTARYISSTVLSLALLLSQSLFSYSAQAYTIVTDIDDTLKISNVSSFFGVIKYGLFGKKTFAGTKELMNELAANASKVIYLSASPKELKSRLRSLLVESGGYPAGEFRLRDWFDAPSSSEFKMSQLEDIARHSDDSFIFLGDDTESDPEIYTHFLGHHPEVKSLGVYIHQVSARALPGQVSPFRTAFDVALVEVENGRLTADQAIRVGDAVLNAESKGLIFPSFKHCPRNPDSLMGPISSKDFRLVQLNEQILNRIHSYCAPRILESEGAVLEVSEDQESQYANLKEESLLQVTSDAMEGTSALKVGLDDANNIVSFRFSTDRRVNIFFSPADLEKGVVLLNRSNYNILTLSSPRFLPDAGGTLTLTYLYNGITGSFDHLTMDLHKINGKWTFMTHDGADSRPFTSMFMKAKKLPLIGVVGIESIELN